MPGAINLLVVKTISLRKKQQYVREKVSFNLFNCYIHAYIVENKA